MSRLKFGSLFLLFLLISLRGSGQISKSIQDVAITVDSMALIASAPLLPPGTIDQNFKILGIGEQSHGTSEFFKARISLITSLASSGVISKIGLEAPLCEVENLNSYILNGTGDLRKILKSFRLFNYECEEFVDLIEKVKVLNQTGDSPLKFFGVDMQTPFQSLETGASSLFRRA